VSEAANQYVYSTSFDHENARQFILSQTPFTESPLTDPDGIKWSLYMVSQILALMERSHRRRINYKTSLTRKNDLIDKDFRKTRFWAPFIAAALVVAILLPSVTYSLYVVAFFLPLTWAFLLSPIIRLCLTANSVDESEARFQEDILEVEIAIAKLYAYVEGGKLVMKKMPIPPSDIKIPEPENTLH